MISVIYRYPEDPDIEAFLMYGEEFIQHYRAGGPGYVQVNEEPPILFDDVICDLCNASIGRAEPCILIAGYLYCSECMKEKMQYVVPGSVRVKHDPRALGYALNAIVKRIEALTRYREGLDGVEDDPQGEFVRLKAALKCFEPHKEGGE